MSAYIHHLALVDEIQPVTVVKAIESRSGGHLINVGTRLKKELVDELANKIKYPCETHVELEAGFSCEVVFALFQQFIENDKSIREIAAAFDCNETLEKCIEALGQYPELMQRFNVLAIQLPDIFDQALFSAYFTVLCLLEQKAPQKVINTNFIAAITHDFGLLDLAPALLFKEGKMTGDEWYEMQQHPRRGAEFLRLVPGIDIEIIRGVLEHHEIPNGTGYPAGKFQNQLAMTGRLLFALDSANAIYRKYFKHRSRSLHDLVPILQINALAKGNTLTSQIINIFNKSTATEHTTLTSDLISDAAKTLKGNAIEIQSFINLTSEFKSIIGIAHRDIKMLAIQNISNQVKDTMNTCGIINEAYLRWIDQICDEHLEFAYRELEEVLMMSHEVKFHIHRFHRELDLYIEKASREDLIEQAKQLQARLNKTSKGHASDAVMKFLDGE